MPGTCRSHLAPHVARRRRYPHDAASLVATDAAWIHPCTAGGRRCCTCHVFARHFVAAVVLPSRDPVRPDTGRLPPAERKACRRRDKKMSTVVAVAPSRAWPHAYQDKVADGEGFGGQAVASPSW